MTDPYYPLWPVVALIVVLAALAVLCVFWRSCPPLPLAGVNLCHLSVFPILSSN